MEDSYLVCTNQPRSGKLVGSVSGFLSMLGNVARFFFE